MGRVASSCVALVVLACGGAGATDRSAPRATPSAAPTAPAEAAAPVASSAIEPVAVAPSAPPDLLHCPLASTVLELGDPDDGDPSAPAALEGALIVAFTHFDPAAGASELRIQRVTARGVLEPAVVLRTGVHAQRPLLIGDGTRAYVVAIAADGASELVRLDPTTLLSLASEPPIALPAPPEDLALGARGVVVITYSDRDHRYVRRAGSTSDVTLPAPTSWPDPREQILASAGDVDLVLVRHGNAASASVLSDAGVHTSPLFRAHGEIWGEASVAGGAGGLLVVRDGPGIADLSVILVAASGTVAAPIAIPPIATSGLPLDSLVRRYPRASALGEGWALTYWDGTGPVLVRVDAQGQAIGAPMEIRSGDERGGHTDARMTATADALAITWQVGPPRMDHGFPEEQPRRPGPRLAILRCAP